MTNPESENRSSCKHNAHVSVPQHLSSRAVFGPLPHPMNVMSVVNERVDSQTVAAQPLWCLASPGSSSASASGINTGTPEHCDGIRIGQCNRRIAIHCIAHAWHACAAITISWQEPPGCQCPKFWGIPTNVLRFNPYRPSRRFGRTAHAAACSAP